jgi:hypothetical protein
MRHGRGARESGGPGRFLTACPGPGRSGFLFDRRHDRFFTEADMCFRKERGANVVRPPPNYRHIESDAEPPALAATPAPAPGCT